MGAGVVEKVETSEINKVCVVGVGILGVGLFGKGNKSFRPSEGQKEGVKGRIKWGEGGGEMSVGGGGSG